MVKRNVITLLSLLFLTIICVAMSCSNEAPSKQKVLRHVVIFQFKEEVKAARREQVIKDFLALKVEIP
jgi:hypothetical protein